MQTTIDREQVAIQICSELNQFVDLKNTLISVMEHVKELSNVEAVSVRLYAGGDYPYYVYNGFPESFILKENYLCPRNNNGELIPDPTGKGYLLDCMCGNIIQGRTNPALSFFTQKGSFWSNNTTHLLKTTTNADRQANTRNYCNSCGYESVALIPIKNKTGNIGLIQLNDKQIGKFTLELIHFLEMIGEQIGVAVESALIYEGLLVSKQELEETLEKLHRSQVQLIEAKKMASLGEMVAGISHELKTPLGNALNGIHIILNKTSTISEKSTKLKVSDKEIKHYLQINKELGQVVLRNIERTSGLLKSFINSSISDQNIEKQEFIFNTFIRDIIQSISLSFYKKKINFKFPSPDDYSIKSIPSCIYQIISNLVTNSYIHGFESKDSGTITIHCSNDNESYTIQYFDDGAGIQPDLVNKIFEPFFTTKKKSNSGLGLSIVYNIINTQLGGTITCKSSPGEGTQFLIKFPR